MWKVSEEKNKKFADKKENIMWKVREENNKKFADKKREHNVEGT